jgi:hypothetical protein
MTSNYHQNFHVKLLLKLSNQLSEVIKYTLHIDDVSKRYLTIILNL